MAIYLTEEPAPIIGFRRWFTAYPSGERSRSSLHSLNGTPWPIDRPLQALCSHNGPTPDCSCGIHSYKRAEPYTSLFAGLVQEMVSGLILCWGRIQVHRIGYRAQYGRPIALIDNAWEEREVRNRGRYVRIIRHESSGPDVEPVASNYGIAIIHRNEINDFIQRWA